VRTWYRVRHSLANARPITSWIIDTMTPAGRLLGGLVLNNPYYIEPDEFLATW
jgi:hypothetical protein